MEEISKVLNGQETEKALNLSVKWKILPMTALPTLLSEPS
jgi:hypothetical protein